MRRTLASVVLAACATAPQVPVVAPLDVAPRRYACGRVAAAPVIDGVLDDACWGDAAWTADFADIEGGARPRPRFRTRAKMGWDDRAFYIAAELEEPHVFATLTARDSVIFRDHDFEVFIDPDGDTQAYGELEINAYGTEWDLLLLKAYRDGGPAVNGWDIAGLRTAVHVDGTIDDPRDVDRGWSVEIAIPWPALGEIAGRPAPPRAGDVWRVNFSRVEWRTVVDGGSYRKEVDPATGAPFPEDNWVWSPQGVINMHCPEAWGLVMFTEGTTAWPQDLDAELAARAALRRVYHLEHAFRAEHGAFTEDLAALAMADPGALGGWQWPPELRTTATTFEAVLRRGDGLGLHQTGDGRVWIDGGREPR